MNVPLELTDHEVRRPRSISAVKDVNSAVEVRVRRNHRQSVAASPRVVDLERLDHSTYGGVISTQRVTEPGAERAIVFQSPCCCRGSAPGRTYGRGGARRGTAQPAWANDAAGNDSIFRSRQVASSSTAASLGTQKCLARERAVGQPGFLLLTTVSRSRIADAIEMKDNCCGVGGIGKTVVMVTHDVARALPRRPPISDRGPKRRRRRAQGSVPASRSRATCSRTRSIAAAGR